MVPSRPVEQNQTAAICANRPLDHLPYRQGRREESAPTRGIGGLSENHRAISYGQGAHNVELSGRILVEMDSEGSEPNEPIGRDIEPSEDLMEPWSPPPSPDDRVWRHPTEMGGAHDPRFNDAVFSPLLSIQRPSDDVDRATSSQHIQRSTVLLSLGSGLAGAVIVVSMLALMGALGTSENGRDIVVREKVATPLVSLPSGTATPTGDVVAIAAQVSPAIVRMKITNPVPSSGSGVLFRDDGYLLTNAHVVKDAETLFAVLADGSEIAGKIVGQDSETDIAVVKLKRDEPFPTAVLGTAVGLKVGQPAVAIGSPLGLIGGSSVSTGVVSALGRRVNSDEGSPLLDMIQTDAAIAPGSSGGALLDHTGSVIGITTAIAVSQVGAEGLGFATPIDIARSVADQIIATGKAEHVWLGIEGADVDAASARKASIPGGARIERVVRDSPASKAGLEKKDIIISMDDKEVTSMSDLVISLRDHRPGESVSITYMRDDIRKTTTVELSKRPKNY